MRVEKDKKSHLRDCLGNSYPEQ